MLRMPDVHIALGEDGLRVGYVPVWNAVLKGFGSKEQGATTRRSKRSAWDTVHPGRRRTFGDDSHDSAKLKAAVVDHIQNQINRGQVPWRRDAVGGAEN